MNRVDFDFCASSFLALRHVCEPDRSWRAGWDPLFVRRDFSKSKSVYSAEQIEAHLQDRINEALSRETVGIMLSGGMDSAILASYLPKGTHAFTLRSLAHGVDDEVDGARKFAEINDLHLHIVDVSWSDYLELLPGLMLARFAPVHSIEPLIAKALGVSREHKISAMVFGENADSLFGGFDKLLTWDAQPTEFVKRYTFVDPVKVLRNVVDVSYIFNQFRENGLINPQRVMEGLFADESLNSYINPCRTSKVKLVAPFADLKMGAQIDFSRIRSGDSKYLIRELFRLRYPDLEPAEKKPMPRAVDVWLKDWNGPSHPSFLDLNIENFSGDQKWLMFALEQFILMMEQS